MHDAGMEDRAEPAGEQPPEASLASPSSVRHRGRQVDPSVSPSSSSQPFADLNVGPSVVVGTKLGARDSSGYIGGKERKSEGDGETRAWEAHVRDNRRVNNALLAVRAEKYALLDHVPQVGCRNGQST